MARITGAATPLLLAALVSLTAHAVDDDFGAERADMVRTIEEIVRETRRQLGRDTLDERVLEALRTVPRHRFVPDRQRAAAYRDRPLPIGHGQTISQPYIVAVMTDLLDPEADDRVLEIGTGSGYQAAVLSRLVDEVRSIEIIEALGERAGTALAETGHDNVHVQVGDGYFGWPERAPFDGIVVTAAASHVPPPLVRQLAPGGRMVIPVGSRFLTQQLLLIEKGKTGDITTRQILPVRFVPLTGGH